MRWKIFVLILLAVIAPSALAKMYKCVDEKGNTYYSDKPSPQCGTEGSTELNKRGVVVKKGEQSQTPEQQKMQQEAAAKSKAEEMAERDRKRRDRALLQTYTSENEIDLARDRNIQQHELIIKSIEPRLKSAQAKLANYQNQANGFKKEKKAVPEHVTEGIKTSEVEVKRLVDEKSKKEQEIEGIRVKFETDKLRYRELTQQKQ